MKTKPFMTIPAFMVGVVAVCLTTVYFLYPRAIAQLYGKDMPQAWGAELGEMTFSQIHQRLGAPQDDATAKDFQQWVEVHWWGKKVLMLVSANCCNPADKPRLLVYKVLVDGWYAPAYQNTLAKSGRD